MFKRGVTFYFDNLTSVGFEYVPVGYKLIVVSESSEYLVNSRTSVTSTTTIQDALDSGDLSEVNTSGAGGTVSSNMKIPDFDNLISTTEFNPADIGIRMGMTLTSTPGEVLLVSDTTDTAIERYDTVGATYVDNLVEVAEGATHEGLIFTGTEVITYCGTGDLLYRYSASTGAHLGMIDTANTAVLGTVSGLAYDGSTFWSIQQTTEELNNWELNATDDDIINISETKFIFEELGEDKLSGIAFTPDGLLAILDRAGRLIFIDKTDLNDRHIRYWKGMMGAVNTSGNLFMSDVPAYGIAFDDDHFYLVSDKIYKFGLRDI